jgi:hypothetical protein
MLISDFKSDLFVLYLIKKGFRMDEIKPLKDFLVMFITPGFVAGIVLFWIKIKHTEKKEAARDKREARRKEKEFTNNSFLEIKTLLVKSDNKINRIEQEQGRMMKKEDARKEFIDKDILDIHTKNIDKRFDSANEKIDALDKRLSEKITEAKNDIKDFITQAIGRDK